MLQSKGRHMDLRVPHRDLMIFFISVSMCPRFLSRQHSQHPTPREYCTGGGDKDIPEREGVFHDRTIERKAMIMIVLYCATSQDNNDDVACIYKPMVGIRGACVHRATIRRLRC
jgi:hypothetical protein